MKKIVLATIFGAAAFTAEAQELVYQPINPSFGGNSFNSSHLLSIANGQNDHSAPAADETGSSQAELFARQLQSRLLSGLAASVTEAIFGENPQESGVVQFGDQRIEFVRGLDSVTLTIFDAAAGTSTEIIIPLFAVE